MRKSLSLTSLGVSFLACLSIISCNPPNSAESPAEEKETPTPWANTDTANCATTIFKKNGYFGPRNRVPSGFIVYNRYDSSGLYLQNLSDSMPRRIPNTRNDQPLFISISYDGNWIFYLDARARRICYISPRGTDKGVAPTQYADTGFPSVAGLYRESPMGMEFIYNSNLSTIRAVKIYQENNRLIFVGDRVILDMSAAPFSPYISGDPIPVYKDQMVTKIFEIRDGTTLSITAHITIPENGMGTANRGHVYSWKDSPPGPSGSCGFAMSCDGSLVAANHGGMLAADLSPCVPLHHKGFYLIPFFRGNDSARYETVLSEHGVSANWCPNEYRNGVPPRQNDFFHWDFGNSNDFILGRISGEESPFRGIWLVEWRTNTWTCLTPRNPQILVDFVAIHFGDPLDYDRFAPDTLKDTLTPPTVDLNNPCLEIVAPNGGEILSLGDTCHVKVRSFRNSNALIFLSVNDRSFMLPGLENSINPLTDSLFTFVIPDSLVDCVSGPDCIRVPLVGACCRILIQDYSGNSNYFDFSDGCFRISRYR